MNPRWLQEAVAACKEPYSPSFPRMMNRVWVLLVVHVEPMPQITPEKVKTWLSKAGLRVDHSYFERHMHGCMAADGGFGFIFYDSTDEAHVQNFTVAHELGHFVLEYLLPRERAQLALGERALQVFDNGHEPSAGEALYSILGGIPLNQDSVMDRSAEGEIERGAIDEAEYRADRVAFELLAPAEYVLPRMKGLSREEAVTLLETQFGLPRLKARAYAHLLLGSENQGFCIRKYLGGEDDE
jgi:Zn-dependent peptidase ImmA (M78 family)